MLYGVNGTIWDTLWDLIFGDDEEDEEDDDA